MRIAALAASAEPHHVLPDSGWISFYLNEPVDVELAIALLRQSFELAEKQWSHKYRGNKTTRGTAWNA